MENAVSWGNLPSVPTPSNAGAPVCPIVHMDPNGRCDFIETRNQLPRTQNDENAENLMFSR